MSNKLTRRTLLANAAAICGAACLPRSGEARSLSTFQHETFEVSVLSDGYITLPAEVLLPDATPDARLDILQRLGGNADGASIDANIPLIKHGEDLILIDNGSGGNFQESAGKLLANLIRAGIRPEQISKIVLTHAHPDHSGATTSANGALTFPNAHYFVSSAEWEFWTDRDYETKMPSALHEFARGAQRDLFAVEDRVHLVRPGDEIVAGMSVVSTPGHTPGHISLALGTRETLLIAGDTCTNNLIFFEHPEWHFGFDTDPEMALRSRQQMLDRAATEHLKILGYHWDYPGIGYVERKGTSYRFALA